MFRLSSFNISWEGIVFMGLRTYALFRDRGKFYKWLIIFLVVVGRIISRLQCFCWQTRKAMNIVSFVALSIASRSIKCTFIEHYKFCAHVGISFTYPCSELDLSVQHHCDSIRCWPGAIHRSCCVWFFGLLLDRIPNLSTLCVFSV